MNGEKQTDSARVDNTIKDMLDTGLPRVYSPELYKQKCSAVFEHFYESYPEKNVSVYASVVFSY
jgi:type I restriction enzyme, R subunit